MCTLGWLILVSMGHTHLTGSLHHLSNNEFTGCHLHNIRCMSNTQIYLLMLVGSVLPIQSLVTNYQTWLIIFWFSEIMSYFTVVSVLQICSFAYLIPGTLILISLVFTPASVALFWLWAFCNSWHPPLLMTLSILHSVVVFVAPTQPCSMLIVLWPYQVFCKHIFFIICHRYDVFSHQHSNYCQYLLSHHYQC